ncbi:TetR/AcrR family transcriptional regulator [Agromyces sp. MMS24-JH15]|uniref:TetR/AcrR family transcriptional regulator n=1 Tax=Agromyces sp. MMS24-JH15 TaxID=3243765 RepID=UPI003747E598
MKPGPRRSLSQSDLLQAAFELFEQKGFAGVSVRGVAGAVGLSPTAVYTYFPSKDALLRAMVEELLVDLDPSAGRVGSEAHSAGRVGSEAPSGGRVGSEAHSGGRVGREAAVSRPSDALVEIAVAVRARLRAHPGSIALVTSTAPDGPRALALVERLGAGFEASGLPADDAARAAHALLAHVLGQVALEAAWTAGAEAEAPAMLWSDHAPHPFGETGARLGLRTGDDDEFRRSVETLVDGWLVGRTVQA